MYRCTSCGAAWSYADVRHVARCKDCQAGLTRDEPSSAHAPAAAERLVLDPDPLIPPPGADRAVAAA